MLRHPREHRQRDRAATVRLAARQVGGMVCVDLEAVRRWVMDARLHAGRGERGAYGVAGDRLSTTTVKRWWAALSRGPRAGDPSR
jgi:hypothetical protein